MPKATRARPVPPVDANVVALQALAFLAGDEHRLNRFLSMTGATPETVRAEANNPAFQGAVLDYLLQEEPLLLAFAAEQGLAPEAVVMARRRLPGLQPES